ncbi:MAG: hypothetical protein WKF97_02630 [Chitinophagaceae bacterium]
MKKFYPSFFASFFIFVAACSNESPTTNAPLTPAPLAKTPPATPPASSPAQTKKETVVIKQLDTPRTTVSFGKSGGSVKTKKGTEVSVGQGGVNIGTKDVKIDIKRDS